MAARFTVAPSGKPSAPHAARDFLTYRSRTSPTVAAILSRLVQRRIHELRSIPDRVARSLEFFYKQAYHFYKQAYDKQA
jgi:hypothetical protein